MEFIRIRVIDHGRNELLLVVFISVGQSGSRHQRFLTLFDSGTIPIFKYHSIKVIHLTTLCIPECRQPLPNTIPSREPRGNKERRRK